MIGTWEEQCYDVGNTGAMGAHNREGDPKESHHSEPELTIVAFLTRVLSFLY